MVWLTAITLDSFFGSALAGAFAVLVAFASVFLVTGTFSFSGAFAAARDEVFAFGATGLAAVFAVLTGALAAFLAGALVGVLAVLAGFVAAVFFTAGFAIDLPEAALVAAALGFFAAEATGCACFAGFFIAFAMESIPTGYPRALSEVRFDGACAWWLGIRPRDIHCPGFAVRKTARVT